MKNDIGIRYDMKKTNFFQEALIKCTLFIHNHSSHFKRSAKETKKKGFGSEKQNRKKK